MKKSRRGDGASSVSLGELRDGREAVTGFCHSTWRIENNPLNHEHFVMTYEETPARGRRFARALVMTARTGQGGVKPKVPHLSQIAFSACPRHTANGGSRTTQA